MYTYLVDHHSCEPVGFTCVSGEPNSIPKVECLINEGCKQSSILEGLTWQLGLAEAKKVHQVEVRREEQTVQKPSIEREGPRLEEVNKTRTTKSCKCLQVRKTYSMTVLMPLSPS